MADDLDRDLSNVWILQHYEQQTSMNASYFHTPMYRNSKASTLLPLFGARFFLKRFYKKAAAFVLRAVAKHSPDLAQAVVDSGALDALVPCLEV